MREAREADKPFRAALGELASSIWKMSRRKLGLELCSGGHVTDQSAVMKIKTD